MARIQKQINSEIEPWSWSQFVLEQSHFKSWTIFTLTWAVGCSLPPVEKMVPAAGESGQWGAAAGRSSNSRGNRAAVDAERGREEEGRAAGSEDGGQSIGEHLGPSNLQLPSNSPWRAGGGERTRGSTASQFTHHGRFVVSLRSNWLGKRRRGKRADQLIGLGQSLTNTFFLQSISHIFIATNSIW
jgi:hypothetical protein